MEDHYHERHWKHLEERKSYKNMGNECSACSCNDQKDVDELTALYLEKKGKNSKDKLNEKE